MPFATNRDHCIEPNYVVSLHQTGAQQGIRDYQWELDVHGRSGRKGQPVLYQKGYENVGLIPELNRLSRRASNECQR
jgi:hypothetical protein